jgi:hypothetical protein
MRWALAAKGHAEAAPPNPAKNVRLLMEIVI